MQPYIVIRIPVQIPLSLVGASTDDLASKGVDLLREVVTGKAIVTIETLPTASLVPSLQ